MSVKKSTCDAYDVMNAGEHASIVVRAWPRTDQGRPAYAGQLIIASSYGNFSYTWSLISVPFNEFLLGLKADTFLQKTLGTNWRVFCHETTKLKFVGNISSLVQTGVITDEQAEVILDAFEMELSEQDATQFGFSAAIEATEQQDDVVKAVPSNELRNQIFAAAVLLQGWKPNPYGMSFWNELWPQFRDALKSEIVQPLEVENAC